MFSASKLYQSVSASGPSATVKPMPTKTSSSSARAWVTRCRWPRAGAVRTWSGMTSVRSRRSARRASARSDAASSACRAASSAFSWPCASPSRRPASLRVSGLEPAERAVGPGQRGPLAEELRLDLAQGLGRGARARSQPRRRRAMPSMSRSTLSRAMVVPRSLSSVAGLRRAATLDATWRGTTAPALAEGLEADDRAGDADVERLGPPGHRDAQGAGEGAGEPRVEPGGLVAQEHRRGHGPVDGRVVLAA